LNTPRGLTIMKKKTAALMTIGLQFAIASALLGQANETIPTAIGRVYIKENHLYLESDQTRASLTRDQLVGALYNSSFDGRYVLFAGAKMEGDLLLVDTSLYTLDVETKAITNVGEAYSIPVVGGAFSPKSYDLAMVDQRGQLYVVRYDQHEVRGPISVVAPGEDGGWACVWNQTGQRVAVPKISTEFESPSARTWGIVTVGGSTIRFSEDVPNLCDLPDFTCPEEIHSAPDGSSCPKPTVNNDLVLRLPWPSGTQWAVTQGYGTACSGSDHTGYQVDFGLTPVNRSVNATAAGTLSNSQEFFSNLTPPCPGGNVTTTCGGTSSQLNGTYVKLVHQGSQFQWFSWYLHLQPPLPTKAKTCSPPSTYAAREPIASSGNTGCSTNPHLHFQMNRTDLPVGDASGFRPTPMRDVEINTTPGVDTWPITSFTQSKIYQAPLASPAPAPIAPANSSTGQSTTPTFSWPSVPGATSGYRVVVGTIASALDVLDDPTSTGPSAGSQGVVINATPTSNNYTPPTPLTAGATYYWRVKGRGGFYGDSSARFQFTTAGGQTPANDQCSGAIALSVGVARSDSTGNATSAGDSTPTCQTNFGKGVWYTFTPATSGTVAVSTCGSNFDTVLQVYTGTCAALSAVSGGCDDDDGPDCSGTQASVSFSGTAGTTYRILAGGWSSQSGTLQIVARVNSQPFPPFFNGQESLGDNWYRLQFPSSGSHFGYYNLAPYPWIYHDNMGWEYFVDANNGGGAFLYDGATNTWFYTSPAAPFPNLYDYSLGCWIYYSPVQGDPWRYTSNPRWFYNYCTGVWFTK
jgi:murein DD-endopeptidase MepM/ murein hydrolase activator NlpD